MTQQPGTQRDQGTQKEKESAGQQQQQSGSQKPGQHGDSPSKQEQHPKQGDAGHRNK